VNHHVLACIFALAHNIIRRRQGNRQNAGLARILAAARNVQTALEIPINVSARGLVHARYLRVRSYAEKGRLAAVLGRAIQSHRTVGGGLGEGCVRTRRFPKAFDRHAGRVLIQVEGEAFARVFLPALNGMDFIGARCVERSCRSGD
jgi:hypothetical protein